MLEDRDLRCLPLRVVLQSSRLQLQRQRVAILIDVTTTDRKYDRSCAFTGGRHLLVDALQSILQRVAFALQLSEGSLTIQHVRFDRLQVLRKKLLVLNEKNKMLQTYS